MDLDHFPKIRKTIVDNWSSYRLKNDLQYSVQIRIHNIPIRFLTDSLALVKQLEDFFPYQWRDDSLEPIQVLWYEPDPKMTSHSLWDEISDPNCHFYKNFVSQRDFLCCKQDEKKFILVSENKIDDGFFNFLRYLLPIELLSQNKILFHSSCVVSSQDEAFLFFGPSGAGKTTVAELCKTRCNVLGDDMNLLSFAESKVFIEAASVGQRIYDKVNFGQRYQLRSAFWLVKDDHYSHEKIQTGQSKYFLSSFANIFWDQLDQDNYNKVFRLLRILKSNIVLYQLNFKKEKEVWDYVSSIG